MNPEQTTESATVWIFRSWTTAFPMSSASTRPKTARAAWNRAMACIAHDRENDGLNMRCEVSMNATPCATAGTTATSWTTDQNTASKSRSRRMRTRFTRSDVAAATSHQCERRTPPWRC